MGEEIIDLLFAELGAGFPIGDERELAGKQEGIVGIDGDGGGGRGHVAEVDDFAVAMIGDPETR